MYLLNKVKCDYLCIWSIFAFQFPENWMSYLPRIMLPPFLEEKKAIRPRTGVCEGLLPCHGFMCFDSRTWSCWSCCPLLRPFLHTYKNWIAGMKCIIFPDQEFCFGCTLHPSWFATNQWALILIPKAKAPGSLGKTTTTRKKPMSGALGAVWLICALKYIC